MNWPSLTTLAKQMESGETTAQKLVDKSLQAIRDAEEYHAIIAPLTERAQERARDIDNKIARGEPAGRLAGIPFIAKDNFLTFGAETTAASNILKGFHAPYQATAVEKLESEGAICVAKANLDAFAHGSSTENSDFFTTLNPHDTSRVPGGSSGGSAAAVVLGMAPFSLGTDTGGSIRLPASFTGCVGYKPTYGLVSRSGVVAMGSSLDCIGPLANSVEDVAIVLDVIAGKDPYDSTTVEADTDGYLISTPIPEEENHTFDGIRVGVIKEYMGEGLDEGVKARIQSAIAYLEKRGAIISEVSLPSLPLGLAVYYVLCPAEVSSNLSRYDGQRYGYSDNTATTLGESYTLSREKGFGAEAKRRIMIGTYVLSSGFYDAYYRKAQTVRTKIINEFSEAFQNYDILLGPVAPTIAFKLGQNTQDPLSMYLADIMTVAANLAGIPAISIPFGTSDDMPVGLQLMADQNQDKFLLQFAANIKETSQ